jgi:hypothetical protein
LLARDSARFSEEVSPLTTTRSSFEANSHLPAVLRLHFAVALQSLEFVRRVPPNVSGAVRSDLELVEHPWLPQVAGYDAARGFVGRFFAAPLPLG